MPADAEIRWLLPAYVAGSLDEHEHKRVEQAIQRSPVLLAETLELQLVNEHLLEVRAELES